MEKVVKALATLLSLVEETTTEVWAICRESLSLAPYANVTRLKRALQTIADLATDLENGALECRAATNPQLQPDDGANVDPEDIIPVDYSPTDDVDHFDPDDPDHYVDSDREPH